VLYFLGLIFCVCLKLLSLTMVMFFLFFFIRRGLLEKSSVAQDSPIGKAVHSFLQDIVPSSFSYSGWNKGRITCQRSQLKRFLLGTESVSDGPKKDKFIMLTNSPLSLAGTRTSSDIETSQHNKSNSGARMGTSTELMTSTV